MIARVSAPVYSSFGLSETLVCPLSDCIISIMLICFNVDQLEWFETTLKAAIKSAPPTLDVRIHLYVTREGALESGSETSSQDEKEPESPAFEKRWADLNGLRLKSGRPDLNTILADEIAAADERVCVTGTCQHVKLYTKY